MHEINYKKKLLKMIEMLVAEVWEVEKFRAEYYDFYLEVVPDDALSDEEADHFGSVQEKLDWVDDKADEESRSFGWINSGEFREWLEKKQKGFKIR